MKITSSSIIIPLLLSGVRTSFARILGRRDNPTRADDVIHNTMKTNTMSKNKQNLRARLNPSSRALDVVEEPGELKDWKQIGQSITGEAYLDLSGKGLSISDDGTIVAIGAVDNDGESGLVDNDQGHVRVFKYDQEANTWNQIGGDINGVFAEDQFGHALSLSGDGSCLAVGVPYHDRPGEENIGRVKLLKYDGTDWVQRGSQIFGEAKNDESGFSVSMNYDGSLVAIGAPDHDSPAGYNSGYARVLKWTGTQWLQKGSDIDGESAYDEYGYSVALSGDGTTIAVGATMNNGVSGRNSGHVRVHKWNGDDWEQRGADIDGEYYHDEIGYSVSLSYQGNVVVFGAPKISDRGGARVFSWDTTTLAWAPRGEEFFGNDYDNRYGTDVSISNDGNRIAIGVPFGDGNGTEVKVDSGHCKTYEWTGTSWVELGTILYGDKIGDTFGTTVSMSGDGRHVAVGGPRNGNTGGGLGGYVGHVKIFELKSPTLNPTTIPTISPTTSPTISPTTAPLPSACGECEGGLGQQCCVPGDIYSYDVCEYGSIELNLSAVRKTVASGTKCCEHSLDPFRIIETHDNDDACPVLTASTQIEATSTPSPTASPTANPTKTPIVNLVLESNCNCTIHGQQCCVPGNDKVYETCVQSWDFDSRAYMLKPVTQSLGPGTKCCQNPHYVNYILPYGVESECP